MSSPSRWLFSHPAGSPRLLDRSFHACCPQPPRKARRVLLPVASSPAFSGFILRGGLAAFDLLTRPNRVYFITAHVFAARVLASSITGTHARFGYMLNRQLHGELLSVHKISQAYPGIPRVSERSDLKHPPPKQVNLSASSPPIPCPPTHLIHSKKTETQNRSPCPVLVLVT